MANCKIRWAVLGVAATMVAAPVFSQEAIREPRIELEVPSLEPGLKELRTLEEEARSDAYSGITRDPVTGRILVRGRITVLQMDSYFRESEAAISDELSKGGTQLQSKQIEDAIKSKVAASATEKARSDPDVSFEVLTGKLTIKKQIIARNEAPNIEVTGGEVNLYKVASILAGIVVTCHQLDKPIRDCLHEALKLAGAEIGKQMGLKIPNEALNSD